MSAKRKVLVADDDIAARLRVRDLLERESQFDVTEAEDGFAALDAAREAQPDLILLDLMMPGMSGLEVCAELRRDPRTREVPIIVLSAADESETMIAALDAGAEDFLRKPYCAAELRAKVRTITRLNRYGSLLRERDRFQWLVERSLEPLLIADERGAVVYANTRARQLFGLRDEPGEDVATAIGRHFRCEPAGALAAWRELRWPSDEKFVISQPETAETPARWFDVELQGIDSGETLLKFTNRSGWVRRELETFTFQHLISHKIRTPLNGLSPVLSYLDFVQQSTTDAEMGGLLRVARDSAERLQETLCSVLRYHAAVFAPTPSSGAAVQRATLADVLAAAVEAAGFNGPLSVTGVTREIAYPEMLEIVLTELIDNYGKFSRARQEGLSVICAAFDREGAEIRLCAPGSALAPDVIADLGRPYWQPERIFTGEIPGVGLGIATARQLLRWRGGDLRLAMNDTVGGLETRIQLPPAFLE